MASVTFYVVDTKRRKNEIVRAIPAMIATKMLKITDVDCSVSVTCALVNRSVSFEVKKLLTPLATKSRFRAVMSGFSFMKR